MPMPKSDIVQKLRSACGFLPMPLSLGWETSTSHEKLVSETLVPGLVLSDIASGATREVRAAWMHSLYQKTLPDERRGTIVLRLDEVGFTSQFGWPHFVTVCTVILQFTLALFAITFDLPREGCLILAGLFIHLLEGLYGWMYPIWYSPRVVQTSRYYALHTGMTTRCILIIAHEPNDPNGKRYQLEDAAVPLLRLPSSKRAARVQSICKSLLWLATWAQKVMCAVTPSQGYFYTFVLHIGSGVMLCLSACTDALPRFSLPLVSNPMKLDTEASVLDMLTAVCQVTGCISCGFIESILPDRTGKHTDYNWISEVLALRGEEHPTHPSKTKILEYTLRRRNVQVCNNCN